MGVNGLLPFLKKCSRRVNIRDFKGYTVAVDAYCWVHRASYSCAVDIAMGNPTSQYLNMVLEAGVRPILVFDGANLPAKAETEAKRRRSRKMYRERAAQYLLEGNRTAARECFERCVEVTAEMARCVIRAARRLGVDCIIAPYESDAQLAYLVQSGYADLVITEDSDLLMFGCKQVIFKLDLTGFGTLIAWSAGIGEKCCGIASQDFSPANLRFMGILSGCDYFPGIPRIGLATAAKIMRQCRSTDFRHLLLSLGNFCNLAGTASQKLSSTSNSRKFLVEGWKGDSNGLHEDTIRAAMRAERTFRLQVVFDPRTRKRLRLSEPTIDDINEERLALLDADLSDSSLFSYAGEDTLDSDLAFAIALGNVDFETGEKVDTFNPDNFKVVKLFNGFGADSGEPQGAFISNYAEVASSISSMLKRAHRPDGQRLNISIWSTDYKLEPVWLYFTEAGIRSRPFCISVENQGNDSQRLDLLKLRGKVECETAGINADALPEPANLPRPRLKLGSGGGLCRNDCVIVPSFPTFESTVVNAKKRPLDVVLASYDSDENHVPPKTPLRVFSTSKTPVTSANSYFASPVSATIPTSDYGAAGDNLSSPIFRSKRSRSLFTVIEPELVSQTLNPASPLKNKKVNAFAIQTITPTGSPGGKTSESHISSPQSDSSKLSGANKFVPKQTSKDSPVQTNGQIPHTKSDRPSISAQHLVPTAWKSRRELHAPLKQLSNGQQLQRSPTSEKSIECDENRPPSSPVYDVQTVGFQQVGMAQIKAMISPKEELGREDGRPNLSSLFSKWRFTASKRNSLT